MNPTHSQPVSRTSSGSPIFGAIFALLLGLVFLGELFLLGSWYHVGGILMGSYVPTDQHSFVGVKNIEGVDTTEEQFKQKDDTTTASPVSPAVGTERFSSSASHITFDYDPGVVTVSPPETSGDGTYVAYVAEAKPSDSVPAYFFVSIYPPQASVDAFIDSYRVAMTDAGEKIIEDGLSANGVHVITTTHPERQQAGDTVTMMHTMIIAQMNDSRVLLFDFRDNRDTYDATFSALVPPVFSSLQAL